MLKKTPKQLFAEALMAISEKKDIDKITVKEIASYSGLSAQTFYNHFPDKYELIVWIHQNAAEKFLKKLGTDGYTQRELLIDNLNFYAEHSGFMLNALTNTHGMDSYWVKSAEKAIAGSDQWIKTTYNLEGLSEKEQIHLRMFCYAVTEIFAYWAITGMKISVEDMADYILENVPETLKPYLVRS